ncbi:MAG: phosphoribosyltransferase family protein [Rhodospirillaceae bacterium]|nr:phosphoribosyltransferase family protein [Rhodospirillaceae bacterium]
MVEKQFISAEELLRDSFLLGHRILESGFKPNYIVGVWRGGTPVGIAVQELMEYHGVPTDHISIRTSSYEGIEKQSDTIRVHGLHYIIENVNADDQLLIVDDVFDSGRSLDAIINTIKELSRRNTPQTIKVATVYYKPSKSKVDFVPDYYIHETDTWLVFPHELQGLSEEEIRANKPAALKGS